MPAGDVEFVEINGKRGSGTSGLQPWQLEMQIKANARHWKKIAEGQEAQKTNDNGKGVSQGAPVVAPQGR